MTQSSPPDVSIVIPCRNEEANIVAIASAVIAEMERLDLSFDLLFIDNASDDTTVALARDLCSRDPRIRLIVNTRNFGQMRSPTYGVFQARGRAVIAMSADFQDPPELIGRFIERWQAGADIVLGVRASDKSSLKLKSVRNLSYFLARRFGDYPIIADATGFGLYDRRVMDTIARINEPEPFFRALLVETGYAIETIPYDRPHRAGGKSNNNFSALLDFALSALAGSSKKLVRVPFLIGGLAAGAALLSLLGALLAPVFGWNTLPWLIALAVEVQLSLLFIFLGMIGDQVRLISERTRATPLVVERERVNFPEDY